MYKNSTFEILTDSAGGGTSTEVVDYPHLLLLVDFDTGGLSAGHTITITLTSPLGGVHTILSTTAGDTNSDIRMPVREAEVDSLADTLTGNTPFLIEGTLTMTVAGGGNGNTMRATLYMIEV